MGPFSAPHLNTRGGAKPLLTFNVKKWQYDVDGEHPWEDGILVQTLAFMEACDRTHGVQTKVVNFVSDSVSICPRNEKFLLIRNFDETFRT